MAIISTGLESLRIPHIERFGQYRGGGVVLDDDARCKTSTESLRKDSVCCCSCGNTNMGSRAIDDALFSLECIGIQNILLGLCWS